MIWGVHEGDAFEWLKTVPAASVDLVIVDPPYESLEKHRAKGTTTRLKKSKASSNEWFPIMPNSGFSVLFFQLFQVLKPDSHLYMFSDQETMFVAKPLAEAAGFKFWKPLVWDKQRIGMGYHYRARYEFVLFFEKGKRRLNDLGIPDVLAFPRVMNRYPTEKPVKLLEVFVKQSSNPGDVVLDCFCGSGSTGEAAVGNGRDFLGCDIVPGAVELTRARLRALNEA